MKFYHYCTTRSPNHNDNRTKPATEDELIRNLFSAPLVAMDIETESLDDRTPIGFSLAITPDEAYYFPTGSQYHQMVLEAIVANPKVHKVFHNAMFDMDVAYKAWGVMATPCDDTLLMSAHLNRPLQLKMAAETIGRYDVTTATMMLATLKKSDRCMSALDLVSVAQHCCIDSQCTLALYHSLNKQCDYDPYHTDRDLLPVLVRMQAKGLRIDEGVRRGIEETLSDSVRYYKAMCDGLGFNPGSYQQVGYTLAQRGNMLPIKYDRKTKKSTMQTGSEVLEMLKDPVAQLVLLWRQDSKLLGTYITPLDGKDRAFTHLHMSTITGRLGSANMNMQNWPEKLRMMVIPDEDDGWLTSIDDNQIELRELAHLSQDPVMLEVFKDPNGDLHADTLKMFDIKGVTPKERRKYAKNVNFGVVFGCTPETVDKFAKCGRQRATEFIHMWFNRYKKAKEYILDTQAYAKQHWHIITPQGRKIYIKEFSYPDQQAEALRMAINYGIQGGAAGRVKKQMLAVQHLDMRLQVHDELLFNGHVEIPDISNVTDMYTPYKTNYLKCWE